jgi:hypothetical protein
VECVERFRALGMPWYREQAEAHLARIPALDSLRIA